MAAFEAPGGSARSAGWALFVHQFTSPIVLILLAAAALSYALGQVTDGTIVIAIVLISGLLGYWQERGAATAVAALLKTVAVTSTVVRDGVTMVIPREAVVPGDLVLLAAGDGVPADCELLEEQDLFVDEAALTGESLPVDKSPGTVPADAPLAQRTNMLFLGTHVVSGSGQARVLRTGQDTVFGQIAARLRLRPPETEFEQGIRRFGYLLMEVTLVLVLGIFAINVWLHRPVLESFLFALALAVGLTPQLLPAIISVNLASGARRMARQQVIVKRLAAIENFGSMDVLCSDKTGTLTEGHLRWTNAIGPDGADCARVRTLATINAVFETAYGNPIDEAIRTEAMRTDGPSSTAGWTKLDEVPYDFARKRLSVLADYHGTTVLVTKGALRAILEVCTHSVRAGSTAPTAMVPADTDLVPLADVRDAIEAQYAALSAQGIRTLGVAMRVLPAPIAIHREAETDLVFLGLLGFADAPKAGIVETVETLRGLGVRLVMITGDNALVATQVGAQVGLADAELLTGTAMRALSDTALQQRVGRVSIFAEVEPNQKERIIRAMRAAGHVVGYMGDGINDAPALHAADVSISVQDAVDVAKDAADIVLLAPDLRVLEAGVREGRRTFANTLKYVLIATSANFGNMFSMAGASLFLAFLPLLPKQILLTNLLTDLPELTIASDAVDPDWINRPHRWDVASIRRFMMTFGLVSSLFDYLTFGVLIMLLHADVATFRTGWFVESVVSAAMIVLVVRTRGRLWKSRPARALWVATLLMVVLTLSIPLTPLGALFGFVPLPPIFYPILGALVLGYAGCAEVAKAWFYRTTPGTITAR